MELQHTEKVKAMQLAMIIYKMYKAFNFKYITFLTEIAKSTENDKK